MNDPWPSFELDYDGDGVTISDTDLDAVLAGRGVVWIPRDDIRPLIRALTAISAKMVLEDQTK